MGTLYLVRHGQASFASADYDQLSDLGRQQARVAGEALRDRHVRPVLVVSGDLTRHRDTAVEACAAAGWNHRLDVDPRWNELDHVDIVSALEPTYRTHAHLAADLATRPDPQLDFTRMFTAALDRWVVGDGDYIESFVDFQTRVAEAVGSLSERLGPDGTGVVFTSGGPVAIVAGLALGLSGLDWPRLLVATNASISKFGAGSARLALISYNDHAHLEVRGLMTNR